MVGSTAALIQQLEDDQVRLSVMKNSPHLDSFAKEVALWVLTLSEIAEQLELVAQITAQWLYLESIFSGSDEIRRQLPAETMQFGVVNKNWSITMRKWKELRIAKTVCLIAGQLDKFCAMQASLDKIQRALSDYLETKRMAFPRFYFLADDDLLAILGNAKQPRRVQRHVKKLFAGIHELILKRFTLEGGAVCPDSRWRRRFRTSADRRRRRGDDAQRRQPPARLGRPGGRRQHPQARRALCRPRRGRARGSRGP